MPDNGAGTYTLPNSEPVNGQAGDATPIRESLEDIEAALSARLMADGTKAATANQPMGGFKHTNVHDATLRTDYAAAGQVLNGSLTYGGVAGGTADALTIAPSPAISAYVIGQQFQFKVGAAANTTAVTLNVNSIGSGAVTWPDGTALVAGDLPANAMVLVEVQATTPVFHLQTHTRGTGVLPSATITSTDASAAAGPSLTLDRNSASPAASDVLGEVLFRGRDNGAGTDTFGRISAVITDATAASEDGELRFDTPVAGTLANRLRIGAGLYTPSVTGGDKGTETANFGSLYIGGTQIYAPTTATASTSASLDFTGLTAGVYMFFFNNIRPATDGADFGVRFSVAASFITTSTYNSQYETATNTSFGGSGTATLANGAYVQVGAADNGVGSNFTGFAVLIIGGATAGGTSINGRVGYIDNGSSSWTDAGFGGRNGTSSQVDGVRFFHGSGGNITSGSITMQRII